MHQTISDFGIRISDFAVAGVERLVEIPNPHSEIRNMLTVGFGRAFAEMESFRECVQCRTSMQYNARFPFQTPRAECFRSVEDPNTTRTLLAVAGGARSARSGIREK